MNGCVPLKQARVFVCRDAIGLKCLAFGSAEANISLLVLFSATINTIEEKCPTTTQYPE